MQVHGTLIDERKKLSQFTNSIHLYTENKYSTTESQIYI